MSSNLSIFKIGVGPSSSHTVGPMLAANLFCKSMENKLDHLSQIKIELYGSLSLTGRGHLTDIACIIGLNGIQAKELTPPLREATLELAYQKNQINFSQKKMIDFVYERDVSFYSDFLPLHENGMRLSAFDANQNLIHSQVYYSIGGGFVATEEELKNPINTQESNSLEFDFNSAKELLDLCLKHKKSIAEIAMAYELQFHSEEEIKKYCLDIWQVMQDSYNNGKNSTETTLPGSLKLKRRAPGLAKLQARKTDPLAMVDLISLYAIAIAEENAAGGRVVTAPTNGACAVVPATMLYLKQYLGKKFNEKYIIDFLLTSMTIGSLYKKNASISGAEAGCQAEIGAASSMAAAGAAQILGGSNDQILSAAEIAMEHHLGLTCDPVDGLVQIPCIERNAFGALKAISAARLSLDRDSNSQPLVGLDEIITTMYQTGKDMDSRYKETALGGLAATIKTHC